MTAIVIVVSITFHIYQSADVMEKKITVKLFAAVLINQSLYISHLDFGYSISKQSEHSY
jgi:hypothetical protein